MMPFPTRVVCPMRTSRFDYYYLAGIYTGSRLDERRPSQTINVVNLTPAVGSDTLNDREALDTIIAVALSQGPILETARKG